MIVKRSDFKREVVEDDSPDASWLEQEGFEERLAAYKRNEFHLVGVRAKVDLQVPYGKDFVISLLTSPGVWGVESDAGEEYFQEIFKHECSILADMINAIGKVELVP